MNIFQNIFDQSLEEELSFKKVGTRLIIRAFERRGITLNEEQMAKVESALESAESAENTSVSLQVEVLDAEADPDEPSIHIGDEELEEVFNEVLENIEETLPGIITETATSLVANLKQNTTTILKEEKRVRRRFETAFHQRWGTALDLLAIFLVITHEAGAEFNTEFRPQAAQQQDFVFDALVRLHARACQVGLEILTLLRAGLADGAHARWRSLHEIAVVAYFIKEHGSEVAEKYLLHQHIESFKAANQYQQYHMQLGNTPISDQELAELASTRQRLLARFGPTYGADYGWAASTLEKPKPTFAQIEQSVHLDHHRPYYKLASHNIHAQPKGLFFQLGKSPSADYLLTGSSDEGLTEPGHGMAIALTMITTNLFALNSNAASKPQCKSQLRPKSSRENALSRGSFQRV